MSRELLNYKNNILHFGNASICLKDYTANYSVPTIIYDTSLIEERVRWIQKWNSLKKLHYAVKANFNEQILKLLKKLNCGADVVSVGEIKKALECGFETQDIIFSGVGKSKEELRWAIENNIYQINVESLSELKRIGDISNELNKQVQIGIRINPEIDAETHKYISTALKDSKFGLDFKSAEEACDLLKQYPYVSLKALSFHLGSQIMNVGVYEKALQVVKPYYLKIKNLYPSLERLDLGGGLGIDYQDHDSNKDQKRWLDLQAIYEKELKDFPAEYLLEVGRFLVARSGILLSRVEVIKTTAHKKFIILDTGMTHLMRPALYGAYHEIVPIEALTNEKEICDVVGPICESTDVLAENRNLPVLSEGDFVAICDVGAYGSVMASHYNLREPLIEIVK